jgi:hypothetical protein
MLAAGFGGLTVLLGLYLAWRFDLPTGSTVAATSVAILLLVLASRGMPRPGWRGVVPGVLLASVPCLLVNI